VSGDVQLFVYPEELIGTEPDELAARVRELGCDAVALALVYHRARRVLPRQRRVDVLRQTTAYFQPSSSQYGALRPSPADDRLCARVRELRASCEEFGIGFRAWIVALHDERLAAEDPAAAAQMLDGTPNGIGLCPSAPAAVEYVTALVRDVCDQLRPESIELEAALYPAWEPSYTLTLALEPPSPDVTRITMQCFCRSCSDVLGADSDELRRHTVECGAIPPELAALRAVGIRRLLEPVAEAAHAGGATLRVSASGPPEQAAGQGLAAESVAVADRLLVGCGPLAGAELETRFDALRALAGGRTAAPSLNWTSERQDGALARDARAVGRLGADGLALYNLTLVPEHGLADLAAAATAFRETQ
jgi:hypothetical protein